MAIDEVFVEGELVGGEVLVGVQVCLREVGCW